MYKVYTGYCGTSEIEHGLCACAVDNPLAKARGLSHPYVSYKQSFVIRLKEATEDNYEGVSKSFEPQAFSPFR